MMNARSDRCPNVRMYVRSYVCITVNAWTTNIVVGAEYLHTNQQSTEYNSLLICRE